MRCHATGTQDTRPVQTARLFGTQASIQPKSFGRPALLTADWVSMPAVLVTTQNSPFLPQRWPQPSPVLIVPTQYPRRNGQAELAWAAYNEADQKVYVFFPGVCTEKLDCDSSAVGW